MSAAGTAAFKGGEDANLSPIRERLRLAAVAEDEATRISAAIWLASAEAPRLLAAVEAALKVHQGVTDGDYPESLPICEEDGEFSPCPTVKAITRELARKEDDNDHS
jgi:hypothetical protein